MKKIFLAGFMALMMGAPAWAQQSVEPSNLGFAPVTGGSTAVYGTSANNDPLSILRNQQQQQAAMQAQSGQTGAGAPNRFVQNPNAQSGSGLTAEQIMALNNPGMASQQPAMGSEDNRLNQILQQAGSLGQQPMIQNPVKVKRTVQNRRQLVNGIQGYDLPQRVWEPAPKTAKERFGGQ